MIRVCPKRDTACPHGMACPYTVEPVFLPRRKAFVTSDRGQYQHATPVTASLDATVALCERVLPDANWNIDKYGGAFKAIIDHDNEALELRGEGPTPAIALIIAILTALEARENG